MNFVFKEQPYLSFHTDFETSFTKFKACLQFLTQEVIRGQLHMWLYTSLKILQSPRLFRN